MRKAALVPLLCLSVAMNLAVIGAWVGHAALAGKTGAEDGRDPAFQHPLNARADLTPDQRKALEPRLAELKKTTSNLNDELVRLKARLIDIVASETTDFEALEACKRDIVDLQARLQNIVVEQLLAEKGILTPPQRQDLYDKLRNRCGCAGHSGMGVPCGGNKPCNPGSGRRPCNCSKGEQE